MHGHRHTIGHEHEFEPQRGLPEALPAGERILWQGSPDWRELARRALHVRKVAVYFAILVLLRGAFVLNDGEGVANALAAAAMVLPLAALSLAGLLLVARWSAQGAVYTITSRRIVMRIGIVLTVTYNLPLTRIAGAGFRPLADGRGDIPLVLAGSDRIAWLQLWPHARPWKLARPEPMLRCVPDAQRVARILTDAWTEATGIAAIADAPAPRAARVNPQPAMAGR